MQYELGFNFKEYDFKTLKKRFFNSLFAVYQEQDQQFYSIFDNPIYNTKITNNFSWMLTSLFDYLLRLFFLCIIAVIMKMIVRAITDNGSSFI